mmetsp:Transcript_10283/g.20181  ORF Transcript_10283/g.20181 Transcript_10283/m.20181 type:complete len:118 (-) Transcript_10283:1970-2323(-)
MNIFLGEIDRDVDPLPSKVKSAVNLIFDDKAQNKSYYILLKVSQSAAQEWAVWLSLQRSPIALWTVAAVIVVAVVPEVAPVEAENWIRSCTLRDHGNERFLDSSLGAIAYESDPFAQ